LSSAERLVGTDVDALLDCARNGEDAINSPRQKTTERIGAFCLQIFARKIFIRNPNPVAFIETVLPDGQRLCLVSSHLYGPPCLKQTIPTGVLAGSIAASRSGVLLWATETVFPELSRSDRPVCIFQLNESRRRLPLEPARVAQAISRLLV
jgi:hypothetical protein